MTTDPNLFHLDWARTGEVLAALVVLSFMMERALSIIFESKIFQDHFSGKGLKEWIAFGIAAFACVFWEFDAVSMIFLKSSVTYQGAILTGAIVAGGSKGSLKLFRDVMGIGKEVQVTSAEGVKK
jgi:hypothetical protein